MQHHNKLWIPNKDIVTFILTCTGTRDTENILWARFIMLWSPEDFVSTTYYVVITRWSHIIWW